MYMLIDINYYKYYNVINWHAELKTSSHYLQYKWQRPLSSKSKSYVQFTLTNLREKMDRGIYVTSNTSSMGNNLEEDGFALLHPKSELERKKKSKKKSKIQIEKRWISSL